MFAFGSSPMKTIKTAVYAAVTPNISDLLALVNNATQLPNMAVKQVKDASFR